jgi:hypothetical protein
MRAVLKLEVIGDNYRQHLRAIEADQAPMPHMKQYLQALRYGRPDLRTWVARLTDTGREFVTGMRDYADANGIGSRGVYEYFALTPGVYEVNECVSLGKARRYCIRVGDDAVYQEVTCPGTSAT